MQIFLFFSELMITIQQILDGFINKNLAHYFK